MEIVTQAGSSLMKPIATPAQLISYHDDMAGIIRGALRDGIDFGVIPNTHKPTLYKAGAEKINLAFGTHPEYEIVEKEISHDRINDYFDKFRKPLKSIGLYRYVYRCRIVRTDGTTIGQAEGVCSTLESKYISRPRDAENTACKMAQKRAFVAATLHAFGLSDRFEQDREDFRAKTDKQKTTIAPPPQVVEISTDAKPIAKETLEKMVRAFAEQGDLAYDRALAMILALCNKSAQEINDNDYLKLATMYRDLVAGKLEWDSLVELSGVKF